VITSLHSFKSSEMRQFMTNIDINWEFILEKAPWPGGFYERYVKVVKDGLKKTVGKASLNFYELSTVLCENELKTLSTLVHLRI